MLISMQILIFRIKKNMLGKVNGKIIKQVIQRDSKTQQGQVMVKYKPMVKPIVMVNFVSTWRATGCSDIWSNIPGVLVRMFQDEINIWINRLSKAYCPPYWGGQTSSNPLKAWIWPSHEWEEILSAWQLSWDMGLLLPVDLNWKINIV